MSSLKAQLAAMANAATYATYIKGITGKSSEATPPDITLSATYTHVNASNPHSGSQPLDSDLSSIAALTGSGYAYRISTGNWAIQTPTPAEIGAQPALGFTPAPVANPTFTGTVTTASLQINGNVGFYGTGATSKQTITGSRGSNAALADLISSLAAIGLIINNTTA